MSAPTGLASPGRLVLVVGAHRSGTTWLQQLLLAHPRVAGIERTESWLFVALDALWANLTDPSGSGLAAHLSGEEQVAVARRFLDRAFDRIAHDTPAADRVVEKTPHNTLRLPFIAAVHPDAWVVHLIRDGRDVVQSALELSFGANDARAAAIHWRTMVERGCEGAALFPRHRELRYEDLLADPVSAVGDLFGWLELPVDDAVAEELRRRASERVSQYNTTGEVGAGKWRRLPAEALAAIRDEAGGLLRELGYAES